MLHDQADDLLRLQGIYKYFPGVTALADVEMSVRKGEVHALIGANGAGKSTLIKILAGAYRMDGGSIWYDGNEVCINTPKQAKDLGIAIIYQELNLMKTLTVAENIYIGRQPKRDGFISWPTMYAQARRLLDQLGIQLDVRQQVGRLSIAQQQMVEIAKALSIHAKLVIMDEPTSSLTRKEIQILFSIIRRLKQQGISVIFISHRLDEIFDISDRVTVLRDGRYIDTCNTDDIDRGKLISMMIGLKMEQQYPERNVELGDVLFEVENLSGLNKIHDVSFRLRKGEVLGFAGLVGSGRTEVMRLIFGADPKTSGTIRLHGKEIYTNNAHQSIQSRIGFVTEDRKSEGLLLQYPMCFNITLVSKDKIKKHHILNMKKEQEAAAQYVKRLNIVTPSVHQKVSLLSGGNQQKTVLAKWLFSDSEVIIMDEPTRGIDVGAKREIYEIINQLSQQGKGIIVVSSEDEEVTGICDHILVMWEGTIAGELYRDEFSRQRIGELAIGGAQ